jgi:hypothetical protein
MAIPAVDDDNQALLCPACGFDLRATPGDRCGECGLQIDRALLSVSGIPWVYRQRIGRFHAYFKTFWQITLDRQSLRQEAVKPQDLRDARAFRRVTAGVVAAALLIAFAAVVWHHKGLAFLAIQPEMNSFGSNPNVVDGRFLDLALPWSAGATAPLLAPLCLILFSYFLAGAPRFVFRLPSTDSQRFQRALALAHYTTAPLALLLPALIVGIVFPLLLIRMSDELKDVRTLSIALALLGGSVLVVALLGTLFRIAQWLRRTRHCGAGGALLGVAELLGLWLLGGIVILGLFPWCIGFVWIALDSLR